jgi:cell division protease FtsH
LNAVKSGQVASIASKGDTIQGTFKVSVRYLTGDPRATPTTLFATEVPTFWNDNQLTALLESRGVQINASPPTQSAALLASLLLGFGPTLLIVGLFVLVARRARGVAAGPLGAFGRSRARRVDPATIRIMFDDVAGIDEDKAELTEIVDFLRDPDRYARFGGLMPHRARSSSGTTDGALHDDRLGQRSPCGYAVSL